MVHGLYNKKVLVFIYLLLVVFLLYGQLGNNIYEGISEFHYDLIRNSGLSQSRYMVQQTAV